VDVFDFALQMELDGEKYYREQAQKVQHDDLKIVLEGLADDELRHYKIIQSARNQVFTYVEADPSLSRTKNVFVSYKDDEAVLKNKPTIARLKDEQIDIYRAALVKEEESVALYKKMQDEAKDPEEKAVFARLMKEEEGHVEVIDTIVEMLNHVRDWSQSAEFNRPEEKY
jgi:rubrerythrin